MRQRRMHKKAPGFTIMEIIASLVIMGILVVVVLISGLGGSGDVDGQAKILRARIRFAQARAMGTNSPCGVVVSAGGYFLYLGTNTANKERFPGAESLDVALPSGIGATAGTVSFDERGRPYSNAAQSTLLAADLVFTLSGGSGSRTVTVTPLTGFVP